MNNCDHTAGIWFCYDDSDFLKLSDIDCDSETACRYGDIYNKCSFYDDVEDYSMVIWQEKPESCSVCPHNVYDNITFFKFCPDCGEKNENI